MNVTRNSVTTVTVTVELTQEEARMLGGLLQAVPTNREFFDALADELDMAIEPFLHVFTKDEDGVYEQQEEV